MSMEVQLRRFNSTERRPRMLKDFLSENLNSCSSSGFKSLPRRTIPNDVVTLTPNAKSTTFQTLIKTIRNNVSFFKITKSPSSMLSLPRSLSRKLSSNKRRRNKTCKGESAIEIQISTVKIKDIIRWKSFRDLQISVVPSPPLDFHRYVTESSTVTTVTTCSSSSSAGGSSWSDGDFLTDSWDAQNDVVEVGKKNSFSSVFVGEDLVAPFVGTKVSNY